MIEQVGEVLEEAQRVVVVERLVGCSSPEIRGRLRRLYENIYVAIQTDQFDTKDRHKFLVSVMEQRVECVCCRVAGSRSSDCPARCFAEALFMLIEVTREDDEETAEKKAEDAIALLQSISDLRCSRPDISTTEEEA